MLPNLKFNGQVTRIVGEADLQRNSLQVKVRILKPDEKLRPEMLCRAKFFSKPSVSKIPTANESLGVFIPASLLTNQNQKNADLWIIGIDGKTAEQNKVKLGEEIHKRLYFRSRKVSGQVIKSSSIHQKVSKLVTV